jgi:transmembrane sensor
MARKTASDPLDLLDPVAAEATRWFVLLHDEPGDESHRASFAAWRDADHSHAAAYARIQRLWGAAGHLPSLQGPQNMPDRRAVLRSGAVAALALGTTLGAGRLLLGPHPMADYATSTGERRTVALADGSSVELSTRTAISVDFDAHRRRIRLLDGEAWFRVAKDARGRPFVVEAAGGLTTALGTAFAVARDGDGAIVSVTEHATSVEACGRTYRVEVGQSCRYGSIGPDVPKPTDTARLAWREGRLVFISRPFGEVVATLDRWRTGRTIIWGEALARRPVTLMIDIGEVDQALTRLGASLPMHVMQITPLLTLVRPA